ncbi:UDP-N-acetylmuramate--L-alanine ligase [Dethiobacter alkaliphilus]|uniref:UDP-N-acetylmuramate--L-alanine ligase n=1 Tax=Dethiobacter alkaliphilus TaxID=427926 RepID=UPI002226A602|nr:UDP-N-acetylmuramate--L-alanine ligase [Dethiobacter alkaliphilus]MCW3490537.1 UDP-N-acetylmuramate--L-alanine ligase [Dethiobacter alkaliphilus]
MLKNIKRIHFIGIGGYGMSALARVLLDMGYSVSGSDQKQSKITEKLAREGAEVHQGHDKSYVDGAELVIYSTAIPRHNPEYAAAVQAGLPIWHRSKLLAHFLNGRFGIAIAGTHGKTTTTSMVAKVLTSGGLDPTAFIGGVLNDFGGNARIGRSQYVVAEADESDNSFLRYNASLAVVTNIEADHMEHYEGDFDLLLSGYRQFLQNIKPEGTAILYAEDQYLGDMVPDHLSKIITYGRDKGDYRATDLRSQGWGTRFTVRRGEAELGEIFLHVPGGHNVLNALAAVVVGLELGVSFADIQKGLGEFRGADRRFQFLYQKNDLLVIDDYAHHPTEVQVTLQAARSNKPRRVIAVFQPHRYSRTQYFMDDFARSFGQADKVFLHRIYAASEEPLEGVSSSVLAERIRAHGVDVEQIDDENEIVEKVLAMLQAGDMVLTMGAGDVTELGHTIAERLHEKDNGPA